MAATPVTGQAPGTPPVVRDGAGERRERRARGTMPPRRRPPFRESEDGTADDETPLPSRGRLDVVA